MVAVNMRYTNDWDVRVDRATRWGNPFRLGQDGNRQEVIVKYRRYLWNELQTGRLGLHALAALDEKRLACWCAPRTCHADVLTKAASWAKAELAKKGA